MKLDERAAHARADLDAQFAEHQPPPASRVRTAHRRRRGLQIGAAALAMIVIALGVTAVVRRDDTTQPVIVTPPTTDPTAPPGVVSSRLELPASRVVQGGKITGQLVIKNNTDAPFVFGDACATQFTVVLRNASVPNADVAFPAICERARRLPAGRTTLPFTVVATYNSCAEQSSDGTQPCLPGGAIPPLPTGEYEAVFVASDETTLRPEPAPVTVLPAPDEATAESLRLPGSVYAVRENGALIEVDPATSRVRRELARLGDPRVSTAIEEGQPQFIFTVIVAPDGTVYYEECCEPAAGILHRYPNDWDRNEPVYGHGMALSPDGSQIAAARADNEIVILDAATGAEVRTIDTGDRTVGSLTWSPDGTRIAGTANVGIASSHIVVFWIDADVDPNPTVFDDATYAEPVFLADNRLVAHSANAEGQDNQLVVLDGPEPTVLADAPTGFFDVNVDETGTRIIAVGDDGVLRYLDNGNWIDIGEGYRSADW